MHLALVLYFSPFLFHCLFARHHQVHNISCFHLQNTISVETSLHHIPALLVTQVPPFPVHLFPVHITKSGLCFNLEKTECIIIGGNPFNTNPKWTINNINLSVTEKVKYLGIEIGDLSGKYHCDSRVRSSNKAFYSLQGAGLNKHGVDPKVAFHIYNTAVKSTILYGCESINISKLNIKKLEICLGKQNITDT